MDIQDTQVEVFKDLSVELKCFQKSKNFELTHFRRFIDEGFHDKISKQVMSY